MAAPVVAEPSHPNRRKKIMTTPTNKEWAIFASSLTCLVSLFLCWVAGAEFNERSAACAASLFATVILTGVAYWWSGFGYPP